MSSPRSRIPDRDNIAALIEVVTAADTRLEHSVILEVITAVALHPNVRARLRRTLDGMNDPLRSAEPTMPRQVQKLLRTLIDAGATGIQLPVCQGCAQTRLVEHSLDDGRRVCGLCRRKALARACGRCGRHRFCDNRLDGVLVCSTCYAKDERNLVICVSCGELGRRGSRTPEGVLCTRCTPRRTHTCFRCGQVLPAATLLNQQAVCKPCYVRMTTYAAICPRCGDSRIIAYLDDRNVLVCAGCAHQPPKYRCHSCGSEERLVGRQCPRCMVSDRITALITTPEGSIHPQLHPVLDYLLSWNKPESVLRWLNRGKATPILTSMAHGQTPISHEGIDRFPRDRAREYLRDLLIASGVLPTDHRDMRGTLEWIDVFLADHSSPDRHVLLAYSRWHIVRRVRAQAAKDRFTESAGDNIRSHLSALGRFLDWLHTHDTTLDCVRQAHIDEYLAAHPNGTRHLPQFFTWTYATGRSGPVTSPIYRSQQPTQQMSERDHWHLAERLLHDESIRVDTRICGLFVLLYGQRTATISRMTRDCVTVTSEHVSVRFAADPIVLPPGVDTLVRQHVHALDRHPGQQRSAWLFPGRNPARPVNQGGLGMRMKGVGVFPQVSRTTAIMQLAAELPAAVLAGFLGIRPETAVVWSRLAAGSWSTYPALRRSQSRQSDS